MTSQEIARHRLTSQHIAGVSITDPSSLVKWMGCIRAQDFAAAKWAIGNRVQDSTDDSIEQAFNQGLILRAHVLQPFLHFITPDDIRWMLALTATRLKIFNKDIYRALGIDDEILKKSKRVIVHALERQELSRPQLRGALKKAHIRTDDLRLSFLLMDAELEGLICSGARNGRQFTYALLDQRAPISKRPDKEESIAELMRRYFRSRGPATVEDFAGWSGLRPSEVNIGFELNKQWLASEVINGQVYWFDPSGKAGAVHPSLYLLPAFDELTAAYAGNNIFKPALVIDGRAVGNWTRVLGKDTVAIEVFTPVKQDRALRAAIREEAERYSLFLGRKLL